MAAWTKGQVSLVSKNYGKKTLKVIAKMVGRSEPAVGMFISNHRDQFPYIAPKKGIRGPKKASKKVVKTTSKKVASKKTTKVVA